MLTLTTGGKEELRGKNRRPLIIALISLGAIVILSLLLLFGKQFVGKAVATGAGQLVAGQEGTVSFNVDVGTSKAASFLIEITSEQIDLCNDDNTVKVTVSNILYGNSCFGCTPSCTMLGALRIEGAFFNLQTEPPSGEVKIADLTFQVPNVPNVVFKFNELQVLDDNSVNQITATPDVTLAVTGGGPPPPAQFTLTSTDPDFESDEAIPSKYTCDGADVSPPLSLTNIPADTATVDLVVEDTTANNFLHWKFTDAAVSGASLSIAEGTTPGMVGTNDFGNAKYEGPCPAQDDSTEHSYTFTATAFAQDLSQLGDAATLIGTYQRLAVAAACGDEDDVCTEGSTQSCPVGGYVGTQSCNADCTGFGACTTTESCNDGIKNGLEACDTLQFDAATCASVVGAGSTGNLACTASCTIDSNGCTGVPQCTEAYCKSTYGLILPAECSCPAINQNAVTTFCQNTANTDTCQTMCNDLNLCPDGTGDYTVDINGDTNINGQDAFIILKIAEALVRDECGSPTQNPCGPFSGTYTCDSGDFRVEGYKGFTYNSQPCSQLTNTAAYIKGG